MKMKVGRAASNKDKNNQDLAQVERLRRQYTKCQTTRAALGAV